MRFHLLHPAYIEDRYIDEGAVIAMGGKGEPGDVILQGMYPPGPHMNPKDEEATAASEAYWRENPDATLSPVSRLPLVGGDLGWSAKGGRT